MRIDKAIKATAQELDSLEAVLQKARAELDDKAMVEKVALRRLEDKEASYDRQFFLTQKALSEAFISQYSATKMLIT